ncbi:TPA: hypothetical protein ACHVIS_001689, partial [Streptococcus suis]
AVVDWQICSCFALQIWPNQLCGGGKTNSFILVEFFPTPVSIYDMYVIRSATILKEKNREKFNEH